MKISAVVPVNVPRECESELLQCVRWLTSDFENIFTVWPKFRT